MLDQPGLGGLPVAPAEPLHELYVPMTAGSWNLHRSAMVIMPGYWSGPQVVQNLVALRRHSSTWMSLSPVEVESQQTGFAYARGHVAVFGLGMGWAAARCALLPEVERVTVIERDDEVRAMHGELRLFERLPDGVGEKVRIEAADAFEWTPDRPVDLLLPDIWLDFVSADRAAEVRAMQRNVGADGVYFWGQELELARHAAHRGREIDDAGLAATAAEFDLPLVGLETPEYAARTRSAVRQWMKGRWLEGTQVPRDLRGPADAVQEAE